MHRVSDEVLVSELMSRLTENRQALSAMHRVNKRLEEAEATKDQFLCNIRNEIANPLTAIAVTLDRIRTEAADGSAPLRALIATLGDELATLEYQMQNIFLSAELEAGAYQPVPAKVDVAALATDVIARLSAEAAKKEIRIGLTVEPDALGEVGCDSRALRAILVNLINNAILFGRQSGRVAVHIARDPRCVQLCVTDDGIGVAHEHQAIIFDRFVQLSTGASKTSRGHGLGLSLVKGCVELLGGTVSLSSEVDRGTRFTVVLPVVDESALHDVDQDGTEFWDDEERF